MEQIRVKRVSRQSLMVQAATELRNSIQDGSIRSGGRLIETDLSQQMGISRGTLREAMRILESEGLLETLPGRGTYVVLLKEEDIREIYSIRLCLEPEAVRWAVKNQTAPELAEMAETCRQRDQAVAAKDLVRAIEFDVAFHGMIWKMAKHQRLFQILESIIKQNSIFLASNAKLYSDLSLGVDNHLEILEAIKAKNEKAGVQAIIEHLKRSQEIVLDFVHKMPQ